MGCCKGEKPGCSGGKKKRPIPWFGVFIAVIGLLVAVNWQ